MQDNTNQTIENYDIKESVSHTSIPSHIKIERGETQRNVNQTVLENLMQLLPANKPLKVMDLPCGTPLFLGYLKEFFPVSYALGADIMPCPPKEGYDFKKMDLTKEFELPREEQFDLVTSISGVMMFGNTLNFIENCTARLKKDGIIVISNDNSITFMDRVRFVLFGHGRIFSPVYRDDETMTQNVPIMELIRLLRIHGIEIEKIEYTSFYKRDLIYAPLAILVYPVQYLYHLIKLKSALSRRIWRQAYPFKHLLCRHYIIFGRKRKSND